MASRVFVPHATDAWQSKYPGVVVEEFRQDVTLSTKIRVSIFFGGLDCSHVVDIRDEELESVRNLLPPGEFMSRQAEKATETLIASLPENIVGKYPFTRIYHDIHIVGRKGNPTSSKLFGHPERDIPGWVFSRMRKQRYYPRDGDVAVQPLTISSDGTHEPINVVLGVPTELEPRADIIIEEVKNQKELERAMASTTKKRRVVSKIEKPLIDPNKIKKPTCSVHETKMAFDPVENKWRCTIPGCKMVKRPSRDKDSKSVIIGKGSVQLRLVQQGSETTVILISDDNVALDITKFVNVKQLVEDSELVTLAGEADKLGHYNFTVGSEQDIPMKMRIVLMGVADFVKENDNGF